MFDTVHGLYAAIFVSCEKAIVIGACQRIGDPLFSDLPATRNRVHAWDLLHREIQWSLLLHEELTVSKTCLDKVHGLLNYTGDNLIRTCKYSVPSYKSTKTKKKSQADQPRNVRSLCQKTFERYAHLWPAWLDYNVIFKCVATLIVRANSNT